MTPPEGLRRRLQRFLSETTTGAAERLGKYRLRRLLGRGGMGLVYEAEDGDLGRRVALKVLNEDDSPPGVLDRLRQEARIVARLQHPNIVPVYEIGVVEREDGERLHFIAMALIEGRTLQQILAEHSVSRPELLRLLEDTARAVDYAHGAGIIHRDLKPANIMVDRAGRPMLMDFGVARMDSQVDRLTRTGMILGTPQYMSPEQVRGDRAVDGRADVYALGVLLYEILTRRSPFYASAHAQLYQQILQDEPPAPCELDPSIDGDLEIVCQKAMRKDRDHRYGSAGAFADDLGRYQRREGIHARRPTLRYRVRTGVRRHPAITAAAVGAGLVIATAAIALGLLAQKETRQLRLIARMREAAATCLDGALEARREGGLRAMGRFQQILDPCCDEVVQDIPGLAEPHYLRGRMRRATMDFDGAMAEQERALAKEPRYAPARYERVVLNARLHRRRMAELRRGWWSDTGDLMAAMHSQFVQERTPEVPVADAETERLRARLEEDLGALGDALAAAAPLNPGEIDCARGLLAWIRGDVERARSLLTLSIAKAPLEEGYEALAALELEQKRFEEAARLWALAIGADRGYVPHLEGRGDMYVQWARAAMMANGDPTGSVEAAAADFTRALQMAPDRDEARLGRGTAYVLLGRYRSRRKEDAPEAFTRAVEDFGAVLERAPDGYAARLGRGNARLAWVDHALILGEDPEALCAESAADFAAAAKAHPTRDEPWVWRGILDATRGRARQSKRQAADECYEASVHAYDEALARNPARGWTWYRRAQTLYQWGMARSGLGQEPGDLLDRAIADFRRAAEDRTIGSDAWMMTGLVRMSRAIACDTLKRDAEPEYERAAREIEEDLKAHPDHAGLLRSKAALLNAWHGYRGRRQQDPLPQLEALVEVQTQLIKAAGPGGSDLSQRGRARLHIASIKAKRGDPAAADYQAALDDFTKAAELDGRLQLQAFIDQCKRALGKP